MDDRIILIKSDTDADGHHHSIPSRWNQSVDGKVALHKTAAEAKAAWKDEGGGDRTRPHILNRSFSGTY